MNALFSIAPEAIALVDGPDKPAVLARLADLFATSYSLDAGQVLEHLEEREKLGSTGFGRGLAIPHARVPDLARPVAALLRLRQGVDFASADGMKVELVFGLLSPENCGALHLHALAAISRLVREDKLREALIEAPDAEALYALLIGAAERDAA